MIHSLATLVSVLSKVYKCFTSHMYYKWPAWQAQKGKGDGEERQVRKRRKGKGAPAIRAEVFVYRPPFSQLIR